VYIQSSEDITGFSANPSFGILNKHSNISVWNLGAVYCWNAAEERELMGERKDTHLLIFASKQPKKPSSTFSFELKQDFSCSDWFVS
jgi:hypothetical protein